MKHKPQGTLKTLASSTEQRKTWSSTRVQLHTSQMQNHCYEKYCRLLLAYLIREN